MAELDKKARPTFRLLDLPDVSIGIAANLTGVDKVNYMAVCRTTARAALKTSEAKLSITKATRYAGVRKVLDFFPGQVHLQLIHPDDQEEEVTQPSPLSALDMFIGIAPGSHVVEMAATWRLEGVTKITFPGAMMKCLVPHHLTVLCPNLTQFKIVKPDSTGRAFTNEATNALPLIACTSLRQLHLDYKELDANGSICATTQLPPAYHTVAELQRKLPNIDTLVMTTPSTVLIEAYASQLTRLEIDLRSHVMDPLVRQCSRLEHLSLKKLMAELDFSLDFITPDNAEALRTLEMTFCYCSDDAMKQLLQLPNLNTVRLSGLTFMFGQDLSGHACSWQELHIGNTWQFTTLGNLNLSSLKKLTVGPDLKVRLPLPVRDALAKVQRAADNVMSTVGKMVFEESQSDKGICFGGCGTLSWETFCFEDYDQQLVAKLMTLTSQCIGPVKICNCEGLLHSPPLLNVAIDWGITFIESVCLGRIYDPQPHVWQTLQRLQKLNNIVFWQKGRPRYDTDPDEHVEEIPLPIVERLVEERVKISSAVRNAAQHYVMPAQRPLRIEFGLIYYDDEEQALATESQPLLCTAIQEGLPPGCQLGSIELVRKEGHHKKPLYGKECFANAFWVVVVAPAQPNA